MRDRYVRSWPPLDPGKPLRETDRAYSLELGDALDREYSTDAHFVAYRAVNGQRLNVEALNRGVRVELTCIVFDVDGPDHAAPEPWRAQLRAKVVALAAVHPDPYYYETRGGARIVYRQAEPTIVQTQEDAQRWSQMYAVAVAYLARRFSIEADGACNDWQRLYRLPRATRDADGRCENWPTWGETNSIGALLIDAEHADVDRARAASKAFRDRSTAFTPSDYCGDGMLAGLLRARGWMGRESARGGWICLCPNRSQHSINTDGTDSTVVYPPKFGAELGVIVCKHGHCDALVNKDWLRFFDQSELERARLSP